MGCQDIAPHILTKDFKSGTIVEYNCKNCGELCKKQAMSLYYQTKERIEKGDRRLYWCQKCTLKSPEFLNKASESAIKLNQSQRELKTELSDWQLKLKEYCPDITANTIQDDKVKYICKCGSVCEAKAKGLLKLLNKNGELRCQPCSMKKLWEDKEYKEKRIASINEQFTKPEYIEKHKQNNLEKWKNDDFRKIFSSDEINEKKSESMKRKWEDEEYKKKMAESYTDERRHSISEKMKTILNKNRSILKIMIESSKISNSLKTEENRKVYIEERLNQNFIVLKQGVKFTVKCKRCNTIYNRKPNRLGRSCIHCDSPKYAQESVSELLKHFNPKTIWIYGDGIKRELDIALDNGYAIEYCGLHWHNEDSKDKNYHYNKMKLAEKNGYKLITIFEDEWLHRKNQLSNFLLNKFNKSNNAIAGRKCESVVVDYDEAIEFFNEYHIQKSANNIIINIGLTLNGLLISCISISEHHRNNGEFVLSRLCTRPNISVIGGLSKMLKKLSIEIPEIKEIKTWSDNRLSSGDVYRKAGFELVSELPPDYSYCRRQKRYPKQSMRLKSGETGPESELRKSQGYKRIWDCGKKTWIYTFKETNENTI